MVRVAWRKDYIRDNLARSWSGSSLADYHHVTQKCHLFLLANPICFDLQPQFQNFWIHCK